jgi:hypothetical protein
VDPLLIGANIVSAVPPNDGQRRFARACRAANQLAGSRLL